MQPDRWTGKGSVLNFSSDRPQSEVAVTGAPATEPAQQWQGWGTALKPALEPICLARKPVIGTVAANVLKHGTGALNIEASRVPGTVTTNPLVRNAGSAVYGSHLGHEGCPAVTSEGRWPANLIHDGSEEVEAEFPQTKSGSWNGESAPLNTGIFGRGIGGGLKSLPIYWQGNAGSASRFYYTAKASRTERGQNNTHPTVKPLALMRYLCRLVTPPGGLILDPFLGSGTTGLAALDLGLKFIGIEREEQYFQIALERFKTRQQNTP